MSIPRIRPADGITKAELAKLLGFIASYDQRTVGTADVEAWHMVAVPGRWTLPYASRAVVEFQSERPDDRLRPGHITQLIRGRRERYARSFICPPTPHEISGDTQREIAWAESQLAVHITRSMDRWATGEDLT